MQDPHLFTALVDDVHPAHVVLALVVGRGKHGGPHDEVIEAVSVHVGGTQAVAEVAAQLLPRQVLHVLQIPGVQHHLGGGRNMLTV